MSYSIFFDESNKLDNEKTYSYYGAYGCDVIQQRELVMGVNKIYSRFGKKNEFHFTEYKNDRNINAALSVLHFFINLDIPINLFIVNNEQALTLAKKRNLSIKELRKLFYVKIPERLFYGLTREQDFPHDKVNIYLDHSPEYGSMRVYSKVREQMNAHSLYRQRQYQVQEVKSKESHQSIEIQMIDMFLGLVVYIIEQSYLDKSKKDIVKSELLYRFLNLEQNLQKFQRQITIYRWGGSDIIEQISLSDYLSAFMQFKAKYDIEQMQLIMKTRMQHPQITTKELRNVIGYSSNMLQQMLGYIRQLDNLDRNGPFPEIYAQIFNISQ